MQTRALQIVFISSVNRTVWLAVFFVCWYSIWCTGKEDKSWHQTALRFDQRKQDDTMNREKKEKTMRWKIVTPSVLLHLCVCVCISVSLFIWKNRIVAKIRRKKQDGNVSNVSLNCIRLVLLISVSLTHSVPTYLPLFHSIPFLR